MKLFSHMIVPPEILTLLQLRISYLRRWKPIYCRLPADWQAVGSPLCFPLQSFAWQSCASPEESSGGLAPWGAGGPWWWKEVALQGASENGGSPPWTPTAGALLLSRFKFGMQIWSVCVCCSWPGSRQVGLASEAFLLVCILIWNLLVLKWGWESTSDDSFTVTVTIQHMGKMLWKILWISTNSVLCQLITIY